MLHSASLGWPRVEPLSVHQAAAAHQTWLLAGGETEQTAPEMTMGSRAPDPSSPGVHWAQEVRPTECPQHHKPAAHLQKGGLSHAQEGPHWFRALLSARNS